MVVVLTQIEETLVKRYSNQFMQSIFDRAKKLDFIVPPPQQKQVKKNLHRYQNFIFGTLGSCGIVCLKIRNLRQIGETLNVKQGELPS